MYDSSDPSVFFLAEVSFSSFEPVLLSLLVKLCYLDKAYVWPLLLEHDCSDMSDIRPMCKFILHYQARFGVLGRGDACTCCNRKVVAYQLGPWVVKVAAHCVAQYEVDARLLHASSDKLFSGVPCSLFLCS